MNANANAVPYVRTLTVIAALYTLHFAAGILIPFILAILFALTLAPLVRAQARLKIPPSIAAALVLCLTLGAFVLAFVALAEPAARLFAEVPTQLVKLETKLRSLRGPMKAVHKASAQVEQLSEEVDKKPADVMAVQIKRPSLIGNVLSGAPRVLATLVATFFFLYFLLSSGRRLTSKISRLFPSNMDEDQLTELAHAIQAQVSGYLLTVSVINLGTGVAAGVWLWWLGVANPVLWGVVIAALNFAPYVGAAVCVCLLGVVTVLQFEHLSTALLAVGGYTVLTVIEGQLITPLVLGHRLALSPYILFVGIICLGWLWGIPGTLMAVPLMVSAKIVCEQIPEMKWLAVLLEREQPAWMPRIPRRTFMDVPER